MIIIFFAVYNAKNILIFCWYVKSSVITEKDNTTKFEILLAFDPSPEILIFILSVSEFTWYLMYRIISLFRLTYVPGIFPGILSKCNWNVRVICWIVPKKYLLLLDQTILLHFRSSIDKPFNIPQYPGSNNYFRFPEENI